MKEPLEYYKSKLCRNKVYIKRTEQRSSMFFCGKLIFFAIAILCLCIWWFETKSVIMIGSTFCFLLIYFFMVYLDKCHATIEIGDAHSIEQPYLAPQFLPYLVLAVFRYRAMSRKSHGIGFDVLCLIHITLHIYSVCVPRKDLPIRFRQTFPTDWQKWHSLRRSLPHHQKHRCPCL